MMKPEAALACLLDRTHPLYHAVYTQRTSCERINSQAKELGIERPRVHNQRSVANLNTFIYLVINVQALQRAKSINDEKTQRPADLKVSEWQVLSNPSLAKSADDFEVTPVSAPDEYTQVIMAFEAPMRLLRNHQLFGTIVTYEYATPWASGKLVALQKDQHDRCIAMSAFLNWLETDHCDL